MKSNWRILGYTALFAVLLGGLVYLIVRMRNLDFTHYNDIVGVLRDLRQVDADWDVEVLRIRTGQAADYDQVASSQARIVALQDKLQQVSQAYWSSVANSGALARLKPVQDKLPILFKLKGDAIEHFKSRNAVLRNSWRFLPSGAMDLYVAIDNSNLSAAIKTQLKQDVATLLAAILNYMQSPDAASSDRIFGLADRISAATRQQIADASQRPGGEVSVVAQIDQLVAQHARVLLTTQNEVNDVLTQIESLPVAKTIDELSDAENRENQTIQAEAQNYRRILTIYSVVLAAMLLIMAWRALVIFRRLDRANAELERVNREIRESQVHLIQSEKMSSLGQMVAGIAHEINTPLAYVKGTFSVLKEQLRPFGALLSGAHEFTRAMKAPQRDAKLLNAQFHLIESSAQSMIEHGVLGEIDTLLDDGVHGIEQISDIVVNLRNFSRLDREKVSTFSVEQGLDSTLLLARNLLKNTVNVHKAYGRVTEISGSPSQINQVFLNIITNAVHAMPAPGARPGPNHITLRTSMADDKTVRIDIRDNGKGIAADVLPKIFDPFFTTKPIGEGTGMGLAISHKIVEEHGGRILVETKEGEGTTFSILLPVNRDEDTAPALAPGKESGNTAADSKPTPLFVD